jgi:hypothetical protein
MTKGKRRYAERHETVYGRGAGWKKGFRVDARKNASGILTQ